MKAVADILKVIADTLKGIAEALAWPAAIAVTAYLVLVGFNHYQDNQDLQERQQVAVQHCAGNPDPGGCVANLNMILDAVE